MGVVDTLISCFSTFFRAQSSKYMVREDQQCLPSVISCFSTFFWAQSSKYMVREEHSLPSVIRNVQKEHHILVRAFDGWRWNRSPVVDVETMCCFLSDVKCATLYHYFCGGESWKYCSFLNGTLENLSGMNGQKSWETIKDIIYIYIYVCVCVCVCVCVIVRFIITIWLCGSNGSYGIITLTWNG
jgi:hypothetical protein